MRNFWLKLPFLENVCKKKLIQIINSIIFFAINYAEEYICRTSTKKNFMSKCAKSKAYAPRSLPHKKHKITATDWS